MTKTNEQVIVIGGGAAGMVAALAARRRGARVVLLERNPRVGKKILATGNGRCNFTNVNAAIDCYHGHNPLFAQSALAQFSVADTLAFFNELGIAPKVEEQGKVFPRSDQASSVLDVLRYELDELDVELSTDSYVQAIQTTKAGFRLTLADQTVYTGRRVIVATGGQAMPGSGSDGNGYQLARQLGHAVTPIFPGLVQLKLDGDFFKQIQGVKLVGTASIAVGNKTLATDRGDILFANYGVSGPPILQISRQAGQLLADGKQPTLTIKMLDTMSPAELREILARRFNPASSKTCEFALVGLLNKRLIPVVLRAAGLSEPQRPAAQITPAEQERLAAVLTAWHFSVRGTKSWPSAQVTCGGVATAQVDPRTMASKKIPGLYFAGEILDIDGLCGGFNLQWAWSSGWVAGSNAGQ